MMNGWQMARRLAQEERKTWCVRRGRLRLLSTFQEYTHTTETELCNDGLILPQQAHAVVLFDEPQSSIITRHRTWYMMNMQTMQDDSVHIMMSIFYVYAFFRA